MHSLADYAPPPPDVTSWFQFALKWTPRAIAAGLAGYYCLGIAYDVGLMAAIDRVAMNIFRPSLGYMGMAAFMPTFQWYSAWGVRFAAALTAGLVYDLIEKIIRAIYHALPFGSNANSIPLSPAPLHRKPEELSPAPLHRQPSPLMKTPLQRVVVA